MQRYAKVLIPELNTGQLAMLIRSAHLVDARTFSKVQGQPIFAEELEDEILKVMDGMRQGDGRMSDAGNGGTARDGGNGGRRSGR